MIEITVNKNEDNKKVFALLCSYMPKAPGSVLHKSIRNKNITLNGAKTKEDTRVKTGDKIQIFFSDETYAKFNDNDAKEAYIRNIEKAYADIDIIFENEDILAVNKAPGVLSQKANESDVSINEMVISYLLKTNKISDAELKNFRPAAANRLDRNTSGIVLFGKTLRGLMFLSDGLKERTIHKYYKAVVYGNLKQTGDFTAYLSKDSKNNKVCIKDCEFCNSVKIQTRIIDSLYYKDKDVSLVSIELLSGKTHQIRAYLAHIGHGILGDPKYGNAEINSRYKVKRQLLHAYKVIIPDMDITIKTELPDDFENLLKTGKK